MLLKFFEYNEDKKTHLYVDFKVYRSNSIPSSFFFRFLTNPSKQIPFTWTSPILFLHNSRCSSKMLFLSSSFLNVLYIFLYLYFVTSNFLCGLENELSQYFKLIWDSKLLSAREKETIFILPFSFIYSNLYLSPL